MMLPRTRLLARLRASEPRLVRLLAPAGYGKASLARLIAKRFDRHAVCDCATGAGALGFAAQAMSALADESHGAETLLAVRMRLHATEADAATWSRALLDAWKVRTEPALFVLENAEAIAEDSAVTTLLGDMLAARPMERVVLICSRVDLPLRIAHYFAPHQILTIGPDELRFDLDEAAHIFDGTALSRETIARIVRIVDGWPIALLLFARFAHYEANIERVLGAFEGMQPAELHEHLASEVLDALPPDMTVAMIAAAAIPQASLEDLAAASGIRHVAPVVEGLLRLPGFLAVEDGAYHPHPLLRGTLRARHQAEFATQLLRAAHGNERSGDLLRAAELYEILGDHDAAAAALDGLPAAQLEQPSSRLVDALTRIAMPTLSAYPNLWIATLRYRQGQVDANRLHFEAETLLRAILPGAPAALHRRLLIRKALFAEELGLHREARDILESLGNSRDDAPYEGRLFFSTLARIAAQQGRFAQAEQLIDEAESVQGARHLRLEPVRAHLRLEKTRMRGDWDELLALCEDELTAAQRSGAPSRILEAARQAGRAAWHCNDDVRAHAIRAMLAEGTPACNLFDAYEEAWHAALETSDAHIAKARLDEAIAGADGAQNNFARIVIRLSAFLLLPGEHHRLIEANDIAKTIESPPLQVSLDLLIDTAEPSDFGVFANLAVRVARSPLRTQHARLSLNIASGQIRRGAHDLHVSDRGVELLFALALLPAGTSKEELAAAIWPSLEAEDALNTLKMCVHRTRTQLHEKEVIQSTRRGYALGEHVLVDIREFERLFRGIRGHDALSEPLRREVTTVVNILGSYPPQYAAGWIWFAPHARHLNELQREFVLILAKDAFRRRDWSAVFDLAERLIELDACDEAAYQLKIEALMKHGDRLAALREYRRCSEALERDLHRSPSLDLEALLASSHET